MKYMIDEIKEMCWVVIFICGVAITVMLVVKFGYWLFQ